MKVPFGFHEKSNRYLGIDQADNGLACGCICPSCKMQLKARHGDIKEHHFAHHQSAQVECEYSYWVAVRSMAKQIIKDKGIVHNSKRLNTFASVPWTNNAPLAVKSIRLDPHIKNHQFDALIHSTLGTYYVYFLTSENEDAGRTRSHYTNQARSNTFSPYLVLEVELYDVVKHNNKASEFLETLLFKSYDNKKWLSSRSSYLNYLEQKKLKEEQKALSEKIKSESIERQRAHHINANDFIIPPRQKSVKIDPDTILANKMIGFYGFMKKSYSQIDKQSIDLTVIYKGKNLWYLSCCSEFFCVSLQETYIAYEVYKERVVRLISCGSFDELDYCIKKYVAERDGAL